MKKLSLIGVSIILSVSLPLLMWSCDGGEGTTVDTFDRTAMLHNMADNIIRPQYVTLQAKVNSLKASTENFNANASISTLTELQTAWIDAYKAWQYANAFNFGPAGEEGLRKGLIEEVGTFPASETKIENNISTNNTNLNDFNRDARGFLAMEYLIFRVDDDNATILVNFESTNRKNYLIALATKLKTQMDAVVLNWNESYVNEFVANDGTDVGSSTSHVYNEFVRSFETIKNFKIGLPLGLRPGQTQTAPHLVEAYYSGTSVAMVKEHLNAIENVWYGRGKEGTDGIGFKEYLENVTGGNALITSTEAQIAQVKTALNTLPENERLSEQVNTNAMGVGNFYNELQKQTRYYKSDMSSLMGIAITFDSSDGD